MRRKTAKEILADSFRELSERIPIDKITVNEITKNCGYSPATFYRQFRDKYDLIAWDYSRDLEKILAPMKTDKAMWRKTLKDAAVYYQEHRAYLSNLLLHTSGYDSFTRYMTDIHTGSLMEIVRGAGGAAPAGSAPEMYVRIYCMGTVCFTCEWILGKYSAPPEEIAVVYEKSLPEPLWPYLM